MHKVVVALLIGATMATPALAQQQRGYDGDRSQAEYGRDGGARGQGAGDPRQRSNAPAPAVAPAQVRDDRPQPGQRDVGQRYAGQGDAGQRYAGQRDAGRGQDGYRGRDDAGRGQPGDRRYADRDGPRDGGRRYRDGGGYRDTGGYRDGGYRDGGNDRGRGDGGWNRDWRNGGQYDWQGYRRGNQQAFRAPNYREPRGYEQGYRRWSTGYRLSPAYYGQGYWLDRPERYRLPAAYGGYRWVRYYDDVALVDIRSGVIADILYSFFL